MAAAFTRQALNGIHWYTADSPIIVEDASTDLQIQQGAAALIKPLDPSNEPDLAALLRAVHVQDEP